ncbi:DUF418 domain-containing protein, partial [Mycobacterium tuberculosis]
ALAADSLPEVGAEQRVLADKATTAEQASYRADRQADAATTERELANSHRGFVPQIATKLADQPEEPLRAALNTIGESLPLMLLGMGLFRTGLFSGQWPRRRLAVMAALGLAGGGAATLAFSLWAWRLHFPPVLMLHALASGLALPHLLMGLGYAALILLAAPALLRSALGQRLVAAGRMAFSNYIGMTVVMSALFSGWGLDLIGRVPEHWQWPFLLGGWALMLGWSQRWLARFRHGP